MWCTGVYVYAWWMIAFTLVSLWTARTAKYDSFDSQFSKWSPRRIPPYYHWFVDWKKNQLFNINSNRLFIQRQYTNTKIRSLTFEFFPARVSFQIQFDGNFFVKNQNESNLKSIQIKANDNAWKIKWIQCLHKCNKRSKQWKKKQTHFTDLITVTVNATLYLTHNLRAYVQFSFQIETKQKQNKR